MTLSNLKTENSLVENAEGKLKNKLYQESGLTIIGLNKEKKLLLWHVQNLDIIKYSNVFPTTKQRPVNDLWSMCYDQLRILFLFKYLTN